MRMFDFLTSRCKIKNKSSNLEDLNTAQTQKEEPVIDVDGNVYNTIKFGNQIWTTENLQTTKLNDGTEISLVTDNNLWNELAIPGYCWFKNDGDTYKNTFGALYNFNAVNTGTLAPKGWHIPTEKEWDILEKYLISHGYNWDGSTTGNKIAKSMAAQTGWVKSRDRGSIGNKLNKNNRSGFSAIPSGYRQYGVFYDDIKRAIWWCSKQNSEKMMFIRLLDNRGDNLLNSHARDCSGYSIRLIRD